MIQFWDRRPMLLSDDVLFSLARSLKISPICIDSTSHKGSVSQSNNKMFSFIIYKLMRSWRFLLHKFTTSLPSFIFWDMNFIVCRDWFASYFKITNFITLLCDYFIWQIVTECLSFLYEFITFSLLLTINYIRYFQKKKKKTK